MIRRVCAGLLTLSLSWTLAASAEPPKKFALDDFIKPSPPSAAPAPATTPSAAPTSASAPSAPSAPSASEPGVSSKGPGSTSARPAAEVAPSSPGLDSAASSSASPASERREKRASAAAERAAERAAAAEERARRRAEQRARQQAGAAERAQARVAKLKPEKPKRVKKKTTYDLLSDAWHEPAPPELSAEHARAAVPDLVFRIQKTGAVYVLKPASRQGGFDETQLAIAKEAFNSWGPTPHPRVLDLVYAATIQFNSPYVTLISGIRKDRGGSRHSHGLAADVVLPGVDDETLAAFFRAQGFCGVGTYPRSHFVHIDTRDQSYFWIDNSKPNQRGRVVQVRKDESTAADQAAVARGSEGFVNPPRLQKALHVRMARKRKAHQAKLARAAAKAAASEVTSQPVPSSVTPER
ncbi:MAG: hypothetical protein JWN48_4985 [Myxococcaceae bacterium]|nr:hypothetical protein [Myxococcaceae bacterium]